ncbi:MAG: PAS domain-containing protein [Planctomycetota bacterium]
MDRLLFYEGTFWELLVANPPTHELYIRATIIGFFIAFGLFMAMCTGKREKAERALRDSHSFLQTVIDGVPDGVMVIDLDHRVVLTNKPHGQLAGETNGVPGAMLCYQVSHHRSVPCDGLEHPCPLKQVVETRKAATATHTHFAADGDEIIVEIKAAPVFDEAGEVVQIIESFRDITERKKAEAELTRLIAILENTSDMIATAMPNAQVTYINTAGRKLLGWSDDEAITDKVIFDAHPQWASKLIETESIPGAIRDGVWSGETALLNRDGTEIPISQVIMSHKSPDGQLQYLSTIVAGRGKPP